MIEWFTLVFGEPKEQAKLFTIVISTILALTILLLNQWFIIKRARNERLIVKLEELTKAIHAFATIGFEVNRSLHLDKSYNDDLINKFKELGDEVDMLSYLYFKNSSIDSDISADIINVGIDEIKKPKMPAGSNIPSNNSYIIGMFEIQEWLDNSKTIIKTLTRQHIK
jgi:hypothetical protein